MYLTTEEGDYLRVDYNMKERSVRLYIEPAAEPGKAYFSLINSGRVTAERDYISGKNISAAAKFHPKSRYFSTITDAGVLQLINHNYGIAINPQSLRPAAGSSDIIEETREKYFNKDGDSAIISRKNKGKRVLLKMPIRWFDFLDLVNGLIIMALSLLVSNSFIVVGLVSACWGIILGAIDIFWREREPIFTKIVVFLFVGIALMIYGYFFN